MRAFYRSVEKFPANALKPEEARLKGWALALQAAFADINIHKSRSVYYWLDRLAKDRGREPRPKFELVFDAKSVKVRTGTIPPSFMTQASWPSSKDSM